MDQACSDAGQIKNLIRHPLVTTSTSALAINVIRHRQNAKILREASSVLAVLDSHQAWTADQLVILVLLMVPFPTNLSQRLLRNLDITKELVFNIC